MSGFGHRVRPGTDMDQAGPQALSRKDLSRLENLGQMHERRLKHK